MALRGLRGAVNDKLIAEIRKLIEANDAKMGELDRKIAEVRLDQDRRITPEERRRIHRLIVVSDEAIDRMTEAQVRGLLESAPDESPGDEFWEFETIEIEDAIE